MPQKHLKKHITTDTRALVEKNDNTEYGLVTKKLGSSRFCVKLNMQNKEVIARVRGKFRHSREKKINWIDINSVVLVGLRDYQDNIVDIIYVYNNDEIRQLKKIGEFVEESIRADSIIDGETPDDDNCGFDFDEI